MRDPQGKVEFIKGGAVRNLVDKLSRGHFLDSDISAALQAEELVIRCNIDSDRYRITSQKIYFITYPYEWCDQQLYDAGLLTLKISNSIDRGAFELKDASAWNVLFKGSKPIFCDHMSFQDKKEGGWDAFGQFLNHFVLPLALSKYVNLFGFETFLISRNGVTIKKAFDLIGFGRIFTRLMIFSIGNKHGRIKSNRTINVDRKNLYAAAAWLLAGVKPREANKTTWFNYTKERHHYADSAIKAKKGVVEGWVRELKPNCTIDFGCNTGEFSILAKKYSNCVIGIDSDHDAVQRMYQDLDGEPNIYPVLASLTDFSGGRGWNGAEHIGLSERLSGAGDLLMMLAIIHHLAITESIPYDEIFSFAATVSTKHIIVELIDPKDEMVDALLKSVNRSEDEFSLERQIQILSRYFTITDIKHLEGTCRHLVLGKNRVCCK